MSFYIKVIYPDGEAHEFEVHEVVIRDASVRLFTRDTLIVLAADESDEKW